MPTLHITARPSRRRGRLWRLRLFLALLIGALLLAGCLLVQAALSGGVQAPWADHLASAHNQAMLSLLLLSLCYAAAVQRHLLRPFGVLVVLGVWFAQVRSIPTAPPLDGRGATVVRLLDLNAKGDVDNLDQVLALIEATQPDIICLQETSGDKKALGPELMEDFPYQLGSRPRFGWFTMLLSRYPIEPVDQAPEKRMAEYERGALQSAVVQTPDGPVLVATCHLIRGHEHPAIRAAGDRAALRVAQHVFTTARELGVPAVLTGDLNGGPFSQRGRNVRAGGEWLLAQPPYPWHGTWPSSLPAFLRVQPDQAFLTPGLAVARYRVGRSAGSDHLPIIVEFALHR